MYWFNLVVDLDVLVDTSEVLKHSFAEVYAYLF
jgi:hypothetical protein